MRRERREQERSNRERREKKKSNRKLRRSRKTRRVKENTDMSRSASIIYLLIFKIVIQNI